MWTQRCPAVKSLVWLKSKRVRILHVKLFQNPAQFLSSLWDMSRDEVSQVSALLQLCYGLFDFAIAYTALACTALLQFVQLLYSLVIEVAIRLALHSLLCCLATSQHAR